MLAANFNLLWQDEEFSVVCTRTELQMFINKHVNQYGKVIIAVHGRCREVNWKYFAGLYRVYTKEIV